MTHDQAFVIPTWNEERYIRSILKTARAADPRAWILIADGGSRDGTVPAILSHMMTDHRIILVPNPRQIQSHGLNLLTALAQTLGAQSVVRLDAHARYTRDSVRKVLETLRYTSAALITGARGYSTPDTATRWQDHCVGWAQHPIHHIAAPFRAVQRENTPQRNIHGHHFGWHVDAFLSIGGYRDTLAAAEDLALEHDLRARGHHTLFLPDVRIEVFPRRTAIETFAQMYRNGSARIQAFGRRAWIAPRLGLPLLGAGLGLAMLALAPVITTIATALMLILKPTLRVACVSIAAFLIGAGRSTASPYLYRQGLPA